MFPQQRKRFACSPTERLRRNATLVLIRGVHGDDAAKSQFLSRLDVFERINCASSLNVSQLILAAKAEHTNAPGVVDGDYNVTRARRLFQQRPKIRLFVWCQGGNAKLPLRGELQGQITSLETLCRVRQVRWRRAIEQSQGSKYWCEGVSISTWIRDSRRRWFPGKRLKLHAGTRTWIAPNATNPQCKTCGSELRNATTLRKTPHQISIIWQLGNSRMESH